MRVLDIMTRDVRTCTPQTSLPQIAMLMWEGCCGVIPVIDARGHVAGVVTDRDICLAIAGSTRRPVNIVAHELMKHAVHACAPEDDLRTALDAMRRFKVRRLPVVAADGRLAGILSIDDVVLRALDPEAPTSGEIVESLREIIRGMRREEEMLAF